MSKVFLVATLLCTMSSCGHVRASTGFNTRLRTRCGADHKTVVETGQSAVEMRCGVSIETVWLELKRE